MFDAEKFGKAMGDAIRNAVAPLLKRIEELEAREVIHGKDGAPGRDGIDGKDGAPGERGEKGESGADGRDGADGINGKDGENGKSITVDDVAPVLEIAVNKWALEFERRAQDTLQKAIDKLPIPQNGKDGRDGIGFDDLHVEFDGQKTVTFKLERGEISKEFDLVLPVVIDKGIYREGGEYLAGDGVTWAGSFWIAQKDAPEGKPDSGGDWRLAVKRGRDGKDGRDGIDMTKTVSTKGNDK